MAAFALGFLFGGAQACAGPETAAPGALAPRPEPEFAEAVRLPDAEGRVPLLLPPEGLGVYLLSGGSGTGGAFSSIAEIASEFWPHDAAAEDGRKIREALVAHIVNGNLEALGRPDPPWTGRQLVVRPHPKILQPENAAPPGAAGGGRDFDWFFLDAGPLALGGSTAAGQTLWSPPRIPEGGYVYVVQADDTMDGIVQRFWPAGMEPDSRRLVDELARHLLEHNPDIAGPAGLEAGMEILVLPHPTIAQP